MSELLKNNNFRKLYRLYWYVMYFMSIFLTLDVGDDIFRIRLPQKTKLCPNKSGEELVDTLHGYTA